MPDLFRVHLRFSREPDVTPGRIRALAAHLIDEDQESHRSLVKPASISPLTHVGDNIWAVEIGTLTNDVAERLRGSVGRTARLGPIEGRVKSVERLHGATWDTLLQRAPTEDLIRLAFITPTTFRRGDTSQPFPIPGSVFGHYRKRWELSGSALDIDFRDSDVRVRWFRGETRLERVGSGTHIGFIGEVHYWVKDRSADRRRKLNALAALAPMSGTGSNTMSGMGVTRVLPTE